MVFQSKEGGYDFFRIPAIVQTSTDHLIAFAEGRVNGSGDFGNVDIVYKISKNGGKTWEALHTLIDNKILQAGNAAPVMDWMDPAYPKGVLYLFYNTGNNHEYEVRKGNGLREVWFVKSFDHGNSWTSPVNITTQVHRPLQPQTNPAYQFKEDWRSYANTPGHGLQIQTGNYKGRIYIPANHSSGDPQNAFHDYKAHAYYTDDHGKTFHLSSTIEIPSSNESTAAELSNGNLLVNSRNQSGNPKRRIIALSSNGGETWDTTYISSTLLDPVCQASLLNIHFKNRHHLLFSNAFAVQHRDSLSIHHSNDDGKTWSNKKMIEIAAPGFKGDWAAYSDLVLINKRRIGILYERNNYKEIVFRSFDLREIID
ncbi:MAG: exo-alpha-sialidase [Chitinophagia bacterium]|nr:exo-alpha-sialidase [Chitinophagia bacterium]